MQSELDKPSSKSVQAEDKSLSNTLSTAANAGKPQTTPPAHTCDQTSTASSDSSIPQSVTSIHTSDTLVSKAPLLSSPESSSLVQTSQTSSDVTKSRQPEVSQPSISELQSTIDAKDSYSGSSNPPPSNKEGIAVEKAPPPGAEVGVAKAEPAQNSQDSLTRVKTEESNSTIGERGTEKGGGSSAAEEELLRLMHPSIVPGKLRNYLMQTHAQYSHKYNVYMIKIESYPAYNMHVVPFISVTHDQWVKSNVDWEVP